MKAASTVLTLFPTQTVMKPAHRLGHPALPSTARPVVKTLAQTLAKKPSQDTYHTQGEAEREAPLVLLANTVAEI